MNLNVYSIDYPEVSNGLKRTFHKKLEVFYGVLSNPHTNNYTKVEYFHSFQATAVYMYNAKRGIWVEKPISKYNSCRVNNDNIFHTAEIGQIGVYSNLEAACAAKLLLIQRMSKEYQAALVDLQELFKRNVPDVTKPFDQLLETHPDLFI